MKYIFLAASLIMSGGAFAQNGLNRPTVHQNDSAMTVGRGLVVAKLADLKAANTSNNVALFRTHADQYYILMRDGMAQSGMKADIGPASDLPAGARHYNDIESTVYEYRKLLQSPQLNRADIIRRAEYFQSVY